MNVCCISGTVKKRELRLNILNIYELSDKMTEENFKKSNYKILIVNNNKLGLMNLYFIRCMLIKRC